MFTLETSRVGAITSGGTEEAGRMDGEHDRAQSENPLAETVKLCFECKFPKKVNLNRIGKSRLTAPPTRSMSHRQRTKAIPLARARPTAIGNSRPET